jgi:hypothetical protein
MIVGGYGKFKETANLNSEPVWEDEMWKLSCSQAPIQSEARIARLTPSRPVSDLKNYCSYIASSSHPLINLLIDELCE